LLQERRWNAVQVDRSTLVARVGLEAALFFVAGIGNSAHGATGLARGRLHEQVRHLAPLGVVEAQVGSLRARPARRLPSGPGCFRPGTREPRSSGTSTGGAATRP
jgi:hypothetical protein